MRVTKPMDNTSVKTLSWKNTNKLKLGDYKQVLFTDKRFFFFSFDAK